MSTAGSGSAGPGHADGPMAFVESLDDPVVTDDDHHHLGRVLRVRDGEPMVLCDGLGSWRRARFGPTVEVDGSIETASEPVPPITVAFALLKGDRPELVVQKLTELGIDRIVPFTSDHCVVRWDAARARKQRDRLERIAREASMQCRRTRLPEVAPLTTFASLVAAGGRVMIADIDGARLDMASLGDGSPATAPVLMIGPEGGWSSSERAAVPLMVRIGDHVLRAETASIAGATLLAALRANAADGLAGG